MLKKKNEERNLGSVFNLVYPAYKMRKRNIRIKDTNEFDDFL